MYENEYPPNPPKIRMGWVLIFTTFCQMRLGAHQMGGDQMDCK